ncbi:MAG: HAD family hydrolase [Acidimicrobiales bacterium]
MLRALVFDFDGLILDTETSEYESVRRAFDDHGAAMPLSRWVARIGTHGPHWLDELEAEIGPLPDREGLRAAHRRRHSERVLKEKPAPGLLALIGAATQRDLRLAVASSSGRAWVQGHLDRLGLLHHFGTVSCCENGIRPKPAPDCYREACAALGVAPWEALAFEDSPHGVAAAKAAGLRCVAVPGALTRGLDFAAADLVVASLESVKLADWV